MIFVFTSPQNLTSVKVEWHSYLALNDTGGTLKELTWSQPTFSLKKVLSLQSTIFIPTPLPSTQLYNWALTHQWQGKQLLKMENMPCKFTFTHGYQFYGGVDLLVSAS